MSKEISFIKWFRKLNQAAGKPGTSALQISSKVAVGDRGLVATCSIPNSDGCLLSIATDDPRLVLSPDRAHFLLNQCSCCFMEIWNPTINAIPQNPQDILTLFFFHLRVSPHRNQCQLWKLWECYFKMLPETFSDVAYVSIEDPALVETILDNLPLSLKPAFESRIKRLHESYHVLFGNVQSTVPPKDFAWAWSAVNSRCVYVDRGQLKNCNLVLPVKSDARPLYLSKGNPNIAIIPFFDFFNHSTSVDAEIEVRDGVLYLKTKSSYRSGDQVFINYGKHDNLFLLSEYGFCISASNNPCDAVYPTFQDFTSIGASIGRLDSVLAFLNLYPTEGNSTSWKSVFLAVDGPSYHLVLILHALFKPGQDVNSLEELYSIDETDRSPHVKHGLCLLLHRLTEDFEKAIRFVGSLNHQSVFVDNLLSLLHANVTLLIAVK